MQFGSVINAWIVEILGNNYNQERLKNASPELRNKIIKGRIEALEKQVKKQQGELNKVKNTLKNTK